MSADFFTQMRAALTLLTPGKEADIILLDATALNVAR